MPVYFRNEGLIDLDVIRTMGVSVKETDSPIGYFGTGLKYAIAVLLREGQHVTLMRGIDTYEFSLRPETIRGQTFNVAYMNDERLPFTTQLGRDWQIWQVYRELHSNTLDEGGEVSMVSKLHEGMTTIICVGNAIQAAFMERAKIFLTSLPIAQTENISIHMGSTDIVYNKGVRAAKLRQPLSYTYNFHNGLMLGEDRNFSSQFDMDYYFGRELPSLEDETIIRNIVIRPFGKEGDFNYLHASKISEAFRKAILQAANSEQPANNVRNFAAVLRKQSDDYENIILSNGEKNTLDVARQILINLNCFIDPVDLNFIRTLGTQVYGAYNPATNKIYIASMTFDMGADFLAATIYEEWLHREHGFEDCTRSLQNFLFQRLIVLAKQI